MLLHFLITPFRYRWVCLFPGLQRRPQQLLSIKAMQLATATPECECNMSLLPCSLRNTMCVDVPLQTCLARCCLTEQPNSLLSLPVIMSLQVSDVEASRHVKVKVLNVQICGQLQQQFSASIGQLSDLQTLSLQNCSQLQQLWQVPATISQLNSLQKLDLYGCNQLQQLPDSLSTLGSLRKLYLSECCQLQQLPASIGQLQRLEKLDLECCCWLRQLPDSLCQLSRLQWIGLAGCVQLRQLPESISKLTNLLQLDLAGCGGLQELPLFLGHLRSLLWLSLEGCSSLKELPAFFGQLGSLIHLDLSGCKQLTKLPDTFGQLVSLQKLSLKGCNSLGQLPPSFGHLACLEELSLGSCDQLQQLPASIGQLGSLQTLDLSGCSQLQGLPASIGQLSSLHMLQLAECHKLHQLPASMSQLYSLQQLILARWEQLKESPDFSGCRELVLELAAPTSGSIDINKMLVLPLNLLPPKTVREGSCHVLPSKLLDQTEALQQSMSAISWISILFATACFVGFIGAPGGGESTGPFHLEKGAPNNYTTDPFALRTYFICNLLTFFLALATTTFCVSENLPIANSPSPPRVLITIGVSSALLLLTLLLGACTFLAGVYAVYPPSKRADMIVPTILSGSVLITTFIWLLYRAWHFFSYFHQCRKVAHELQKKMAPLYVTLPRKKDV